MCDRADARVVIGATVVAWHPRNENWGTPAAWYKGKVVKHNLKSFGVEWEMSG